MPVDSFRVISSINTMPFFTTLEFADLSEMDLEYADLKGANLDHANLYFTNLRFADLRDASLRYARTYGTQFGGAILEGAQRRVHHSMHSFL